MGRTALVTGASSGIGRELSRLFAAAGYDLVLVARNRERLAAVADEVQNRHGIRSWVLPHDLAEPEAAGELHAAVAALGLAIDVLANNAGIGLHGPFVDADLDAQHTLLGVNVVAPTLLCHLFGRDMAARRRGRILNVASTAAFQPGPLMSTYYASKAYLLSLSEGLHRELRPAGVTVTALCPGGTRTDFFRRAGMDDIRLTRNPFLMEPAAVAAAGYAGLMRGQALVIPGAANKVAVFLTRLAPRRLTALAAEYYNRRPGDHGGQ